MVKPSRSEPEEDVQGKTEWEQCEASSAYNKRRSPKPARSEPADEDQSLSIEPQMRHQPPSVQPSLLDSTTTSAEATDDYTASDYYEGLRSVSHHPTGTG